MKHRVYSVIIRAVKEARLKESFTKGVFRRANPGFGEGTYNSFLYKHR